MTAERARVLVIEDEPDLRRLLRIVLERGGYEMLEAADGRAGLRVMHDERPDLIILDIGLPVLDGWQVLERVRDVSDVPVLLLTARALEAEKVRALHAGADDYVTKPFGREELVARVHTLLRRARPRDDDERPDRYDDGVVSVEFATREVAVRGEPVSLTPTEWRLLAALVRHAGQVLSPDQLLEQAWEDPTGVGRDRVKFAVLRLRRKLGFEAHDSQIESVRGFGYRYRTS
jgi:DNA-binding response OmpR family regulator